MFSDLKKLTTSPTKFINLKRIENRLIMSKTLKGQNAYLFKTFILNSPILYKHNRYELKKITFLQTKRL